MGTGLDNQETLNAMSKTFDALMRLAEQALSRDLLKEKERKLLEKFVQGHGSIHGAFAPHDHAEIIKEELVRQHIPFAATPSKDGTVILVREQYKDQLLAIQKAAALKDTRYSKEVSLKTCIDVMRMEKNKQTVELSFNNREMASIAQQKLFQAGCTSASYDEDDKSKIVIFNDSLFNETGKDLEAFKLNYVITQVYGDDMFKKPGEHESELISVRKAQETYDRRMMQQFAQAALRGEHVVLGDINGKSQVYLEAIDDQILLMNNGNVTPLVYDPSDDLESVMALISRQSDRIYNMMCFDGTYYNDKLKDRRVSFDELSERYKKDKRPTLSDPHMYDVQQFMNHAAKNLMRDINTEATKRVMQSPNYALLSNEQKMQRKHEFALDLLKNPDCQPVQEFLTAHNTSNISFATRKEILDKMIHCYEDEHQNDAYSVDVDTVTLRTLEEKENKGFAQEKTLEEPTLDV